jgi:DNA mismatch repair protein MutL
LERRPAARSPGTTVEVCDLFHNTPARLAFLRAARSEAAAAVRAVSDLALTRPEVGFTCRSDDRLALRSPGGSLTEAAAAVFRRDAGELVVVDAGGEVEVNGLISEPRSHRGTRTGLVIVVNRRRVHNRALVAAVEEAYAGLLPVGRHPFGVVQVTLDPTLVDVNVHPTKREVRLREEGRVFAAVQRAPSQPWPAPPAPSSSCATVAW